MSLWCCCCPHFKYGEVEVQSVSACPRQLGGAKMKLGLCVCKAYAVIPLLVLRKNKGKERSGFKQELSIFPELWSSLHSNPTTSKRSSQIFPFGIHRSFPYMSIASLVPVDLKVMFIKSCVHFLLSTFMSS